MIKQWVIQSLKNLKKVCAKIKNQWGKSTSQKTVERIVKSLAMTWRRIRLRPKGQLNIKPKSKPLKHYNWPITLGESISAILQSGFCLTPYLPSAWQEKGETMALPSSHSQRLNVLGFLNIDNQLTAYPFKSTVDSQVVIACIDEFCKQMTQKTILVIDNATIHTSGAFSDKIAQWKAKGLEIFYLPKYSPQLNLIEILWRRIKYQWMPKEAYLSFSHLGESVENVIRNFGTKYQINFV